MMTRSASGRGRLGESRLAIDLGGDLLVDRLIDDSIGLRERLADLDDGRVFDERDDAGGVRLHDARQLVGQALARDE